MGDHPHCKLKMAAIVGGGVSLPNFITFFDSPTYVLPMLYALFGYTIKG